MRSAKRSFIPMIGVLALILLVTEACAAPASGILGPSGNPSAESATSAPRSPVPAATEAAPSDAAPLLSHSSPAAVLVPTSLATPAAAPTATSADAPAAPITVVATPAAPAAAPVTATSVLVTLADVAIKLDRPSTSAGSVTFQIKNAGTVIHQLAVLKTDVPQNQIPVNPAQAGTVLEPGLVAQTPTLAPGASTTLTLTLGPGSYVLLCNQPAHYLIGMHTAFKVN